MRIATLYDPTTQEEYTVLTDQEEPITYEKPLPAWVPEGWHHLPNKPGKFYNRRPRPDSLGSEIRTESELRLMVFEERLQALQEELNVKLDSDGKPYVRPDMSPLDDERITMIAGMFSGHAPTPIEAARMALEIQRWRDADYRAKVSSGG